ncbi:Lipase-3 domain-containing protein [Mycena kentingensis (nom. inval.)]|nr:Lipase-3 domain-containing protein [Mycena kentingensis (nom. inval.)]
MLSTPLLLFTAVAAVLAAPTPSRVVRPRQDVGVTALTQTDLSALDSFTQFARAAYCPVDKLMAWDCGGMSVAAFNRRFINRPQRLAKPTKTLKFPSPEDGEMPFNSTNSVIVAHQGTDPLALMSVLTDLKVLKGELNTTLFPGIPEGVEAHVGFRDEHALTADQIRDEVKRLIAEKGATQVTTVGHSLGGALAELDALSLRLNLPAEIGVNAVTYGTPRVGNPEFVKFFDSQVSLTYTRPIGSSVNMSRSTISSASTMRTYDLVPIIPGRFLDFEHPKGEIHIIDDDTNQIVACPGNDDEDNDECQIKTVPSILSGNIIDHLGPYNGIFIGSVFCN